MVCWFAVSLNTCRPTFEKEVLRKEAFEAFGKKLGIRGTVRDGRDSVERTRGKCSGDVHDFKSKVSI